MSESLPLTVASVMQQLKKAEQLLQDRVGEESKDLVNRFRQAMLDAVQHAATLSRAEALDPSETGGEVCFTLECEKMLIERSEGETLAVLAKHAFRQDNPIRGTVGGFPPEFSQN
jgi:hypothetical protein